MSASSSSSSSSSPMKESDRKSSRNNRTTPYCPRDKGAHGVDENWKEEADSLMNKSSMSMLTDRLSRAIKYNTHHMSYAAFRDAERYLMDPLPYTSRPIAFPFPQRSPEWFAARAEPGMISGTMASALMGGAFPGRNASRFRKNADKPFHDTGAWMDYLFPGSEHREPFTGNVHTQRGTDNEPMAAAMFSHWFENMCGYDDGPLFFRLAYLYGSVDKDKVGGNLRASPDLIIVDKNNVPVALVEIKCPQYDNGYPPSDAYLLQMAMQMYVLRVKICIYLMYTTNATTGESHMHLRVMFMTGEMVHYLETQSEVLREIRDKYIHWPPTSKDAAERIAKAADDEYAAHPRYIPFGARQKSHDTILMPWIDIGTHMTPTDEIRKYIATHADDPLPYYVPPLVDIF